MIVCTVVAGVEVTLMFFHYSHAVSNTEASVIVAIVWCCYWWSVHCHAFFLAVVWPVPFSHSFIMCINYHSCSVFVLVYSSLRTIFVRWCIWLQTVCQSVFVCSCWCVFSDVFINCLLMLATVSVHNLEWSSVGSIVGRSLWGKSVLVLFARWQHRSF